MKIISPCTVRLLSRAMVRRASSAASLIVQPPRPLSSSSAALSLSTTAFMKRIISFLGTGTSPASNIGSTTPGMLTKINVEPCLTICS